MAGQNKVSCDLYPVDINGSCCIRDFSDTDCRACGEIKRGTSFVIFSDTEFMNPTT